MLLDKMTDIQKILADNVRNLRNKKRLTQIQLSNLCDMSTNYIGLLETGNVFPSPFVIEQIAEVLGVKSYELFCGDASLINIINEVKVLKKVIASLNIEIDDFSRKFDK